MKKIFMISAGCLLSLAAFAQTHYHHHRYLVKKEKVKHIVTAPDSVKMAFQQKVMLPDSSVAWQKDPNGNWTAHYLTGQDSTSIEFTSGGQWVATRTTYSSNDIPNNITSIVKNKYADANIENGWKIELSTVPAYYKVNIDENGTEKSVFLNDQGTITE